MAHSPDNKPSTTFMDLPTEIRMEIYGYLLIEPQPITLSAYNQKTDQRKAPHPNAIGLKVVREVVHHRATKKRNRGQIYDPSARAWISAPPLRTAILHANKQVHSEATQVLMGKNFFSFRNTKALDKCLDVLGPQAQHLRYISITGKGYIKKYAKQAFEKLAKTAKLLKKLQLSHIDLCEEEYSSGARMSADKLVHDCLILLQTLQHSHEDQGITFDVLGVIDAQLHYCTSWGCGSSPAIHRREMPAISYRDRDTCGCSCAEAEQNHAKIRAELRQVVARELGLSVEGVADAED